MPALLLSEVWLLIKAQMRRIPLYFPLAQGIPWVDDLRIINGVIFVVRNGLRWRDSPPRYPTEI